LERYNDHPEPDRTIKAQATWAREQFCDPGAILNLKAMYLSAGGAFKHLMCMLLAMKVDIEDAIFTSHKDRHGSDLTDNLRAQRTLLYKILSIPAQVNKAEDIADQLQNMGESPQAPDGEFEFMGAPKANLLEEEVDGFQFLR
jgi:hypothetical protein